MSDEYPNLFEKQCDESDCLQDAKETIRAIRNLRAHYSDSLLPVDQDKLEKLDKAQDLVQDVINRERSNIATTLAVKYTRNPEYRHHDPSDPGVLDDFEEWTPDRDIEGFHD